MFYNLGGWKAAVGVVVGLLAVLAIVVAGYFVYKRRIAKLVKMFKYINISIYI